MALLMGIINLTPDSFHEPSRVKPGDVAREARRIIAAGASILDLGAVSSRPGAEEVGVEEEWARLRPALESLRDCGCELSIDTTSSEIVRRAYGLVGRFIVNDISAGEEDPRMLDTVHGLGLRYVAMHRRGNPRTMDTLCDYPDGVVEEILRYFREFSLKAGDIDWMLDPGLGFAKTPAQCWETMRSLERFREFGRPLLVGYADKRFLSFPPDGVADGPAYARELSGKADIVRLHL